MFALVDCNSFYASCEILFRPDLKGKSVICASNNDGCVVARSKEAKLLGIPMGAPLFKIKEVISKHGVHVFSSNYSLYADISARVMQTLSTFTPNIEVYSIDEAFLDFGFVPTATARHELGVEIREVIGRWIGMPVCVGIGPSKTLSKLANNAAKKFNKTGGVVELSDHARQRRLMAITPVSDVWGVGRQITKRLKPLGIETALQLADADPKTIRQQFSVVLERTQQELNGVACIGLEDAPAPKKEIVCSRAFGQRVTNLQEMEQAVCDYMSRAAEKLRREQRCTRRVTVFIHTSLFSANEPQYSNSATLALTSPTDDTRALLHAGKRLLRSIWRDGYRYSKAGVLLSDFWEPNVHQVDMFSGPTPTLRNGKTLMSVMDDINNSGVGKVWFAGKGTDKSNTWSMQRLMLSPSFTTRWDDLPVAK